METMDYGSTMSPHLGIVSTCSWQRRICENVTSKKKTLWGNDILNSLGTIEEICKVVRGSS